MPKTCLTCLSHNNLLDLGKREWKVLEYLIYPSKKYLTDILKANEDSALCNDCQSSMICVDVFRTSAMGNFHKLMDIWEKGTKTDQIDIKLEPEAEVSADCSSVKTEQTSTIKDIKVEQVCEGQINHDKDEGNEKKNISDVQVINSANVAKDTTKIMLTYDLHHQENIFITKVPTNIDNSVRIHALKNIKSKLHSDNAKSTIVVRIPAAADLKRINSQKLIRTVANIITNEKKYEQLEGFSGDGKSTEKSDGSQITNTQNTLPKINTLPSISSASNNKFNCNYCDKSYCSPSGLRHHVEVSHELAPAVCIVCNKTSKNASLLKKHMRIHKNKDIHCDICDKWYSKESYKIHVSTSVKHRKDIDPMEQMEECKICNKSYKDLKHHTQIQHNAEKQYCSVCDKWFNPYTYKIHMQYTVKHRTENTLRFMCEYCNKKFIRKYLLKEHIKIVHLKVRPFECPRCPKVFSQNKELTRHIRHVHDKIQEPKIHVCEVCGKAFHSRRLLRNHMPVHTGERPYKCGKCDATFGFRAALYLHNRYKHEKRPKTKKTAPTTEKRPKTKKTAPTTEKRPKTKKTTPTTENS